MLPAAIDISPERELDELKRYLGDRFSQQALEQHEHRLEREFLDADDETSFYRTTERYLYDLTVFAMSRTKVPYLRAISETLPPGASVLDYGCGIGSDGLALLEAGYDVAFADFANPSTEYLRWRLTHRHLDARVFDIENDEIPSTFDLAYAFDVIEHVPDPEVFLETMESKASSVLVNLLEPEPGETALHHQLPIAALADRARRLGLLRYRVLHRRSHLLLYRSEGGEVSPWRSRLERERGRVSKLRARL
jgi:SAM-dependent methyltransferase